MLYSVLLVPMYSRLEVVLNKAQCMILLFRDLAWKLTIAMLFEIPITMTSLVCMLKICGLFSALILYTRVCRLNAYFFANCVLPVGKRGLREVKSA